MALIISCLDIGTVHLAVALAAAGDVKPTGAFVIMLEEQLVETAVLKDEFSIKLACGFVGEPDIDCLASLVLRVRYSSH